jgi:YVTN family beta-propeller protein
MSRQLMRGSSSPTKPVGGSISSRLPANPARVCSCGLGPDGAEAWITDHGADELFVVDTATLEVLATIALPGAPHHVAITPDGALAAVADHTNGQLLVYGTDTREHIGSVDVGAGPHGVWAVPAPPPLPR